MNIAWSMEQQTVKSHESLGGKRNESPLFQEVGWCPTGNAYSKLTQQNPLLISSHGNKQQE